MPLPVTRATLQCVLFTEGRIFFEDAMSQLLNEEIRTMAPLGFDPDWQEIKDGDDPRSRITHILQDFDGMAVPVSSNKSLYWLEVDLLTLKGIHEYYASILHEPLSYSKTARCRVAGY